MTINKVLERIRALKRGVDVTEEQLRDYIRTVEYIILQDIISGREGAAALADQVGGVDFQHGNAPLLADAPYDVIYEQYACAQIDLLTEDADRYINDLAVFRDTYIDFKRYWWRTHRQVNEYRYHQ